jgi:hypothetical protein
MSNTQSHAERFHINSIYSRFTALPQPLLLPLLLFLLLLSLTSCSRSSSDTNFYVSTAGNDAWSGTLAEPNSAGTDGPFATLERAQEAIRTYKSTSGIPERGLYVLIREGVYPRSASFRLDSLDSGTEIAPIVWAAYLNEEVRLSGGLEITGFAAVSDSSTMARLHPDAAANVQVTDLRAQGITDFGEITPRGGPGLELFFNEERMQLSRWPNEGFVQIADVPQTGTLVYAGDPPHVREGVIVGRQYGRFVYSEDAPSRWTKTDQVILHGYWSWDWFDEFVKIDRIDPAKKEIWPSESGSRYGYTKNQRFYAMNILEELDQPGEWYLDREDGLLYFWPPSPIKDGRAYVSLLDEPMLVMDSTVNVWVHSITFEHSRSSAIEINGGQLANIDGCTIRNIGGTGVIIRGGFNHYVTGCDIHHIGGAGMEVAGGDRKTLTPGNHQITDNHIHHYSGWVRTYLGAVNLNGVGNYVANNLIHDAPHTGILLNGNENIIEFNELHSLAQQTGDVGAFYIGRDWTQRGNVIRHNYFHDLEGPGLHGVMAVYLDDWASGTIIYGNIFYRSGRSVFVGSGRDNIIENNVFIECEPSVHFDVRGRSWASYYFDKENPLYLNTLFDRMDAMNYSQPPYSERYPELLTYYDDEPDLPKGNKVLRNVSYGGTWTNLIEGVDFKMVEYRDNLIADPVIATWERSVGAPQEVYANGDTLIARELNGNVIMQGNPGFMDLEKLDFRLRSDSKAFEMGFKAIPVEKIGLRRK